MLHKRWVVLSAFLSFSALAGVSLEEKQNRIEYLEDLQAKVPMMDIDAYRRELRYEKMELSIEERAKSEAALIAEQIKTQITRAYEASLTKKSPEEAASEIREAIEKDTLLVAPELRSEIKALSLRTLEHIQAGEISSQGNLDGIQKAVMKGVQERYDFLNEEGETIPLSGMDINAMSDGPVANNNEKQAYVSKAELMQSLVSDGENVHWISGGGVTLKSSRAVKKDSNVNMQVKAEFLGVALSAGPTFSFSREYSSDVTIMADGMNPVLLSDVTGSNGDFDFYKKDAKGKPVKRFINFTCNTTLDFGSEIKAGGGFTVAGIGATGNLSTSYKNTVSLSSRRVAVPEKIDGKATTFKMLTELCTNDFLKARVTSNMTIADSLNIMMKNVVSSLRYSHPKTRCARDSHCYNWFNNELGMIKLNNFPRCVGTSEAIYTCQLKGLEGQNCPVYDAKGTRISDGMFEFKCDTGLKCVQYQSAGWFRGWDIYKFAKGKCMPINRKTYRNPFDVARENSRYIEVELMD